MERAGRKEFAGVKNILNNSTMLSQDQIKKILKEKDIKVLKILGQNFLVDESVLNRIIQAAELDKNDLVIEIGPGLGVLTKELSKKCQQVIAIEKDKKLARLLEEKIPPPAPPKRGRACSPSDKRRASVPPPDKGGIGGVKIINDDILKINLEELIGKYGRRTSVCSPSNKNYKLVSNIPYYITSPVIKFFLENKIQPQVIVLLVQKEVAERICAQAGKLSILALSVQIYGKPEIVEYVDKSSFYPKPKVDSAILKISAIKKEFSDDYYQSFFRIIKIGFSAKRKKLANNLSAGLCLSKDKISKILQKANIPPNARAQELELKDWKKLLELMR